MLLTITTTHVPATDLGYLLHKHPARAQAFPLAFGTAHVFFPEATAERCTAALLLDVDPIGLVRRPGQSGPEGHELQPYVNDRPYVASSLLSVALAEVFGTAMGGRSRERPELAAASLPLEARLAVLPDRSGGGLLRRLFEPLGYELDLRPHTLDDAFPDWGASPFFTVGLRARLRLAELLAHLYVLVPVMDDHKHYWVGDAEVDKLLRRGEGWLAGHPERELIARRYLRHSRSLAAAALDRLLADAAPDPDAAEAIHDEQEAGLEQPLSLDEQRLEAVAAALKASGATRVVDVGCGEGKLVQRLLREPQFVSIGGLDVSHRALERAARRLGLDRLPEAQRARLELWHGSVLYRDTRLARFDAAAVVEVIEHLDAGRLAAFEYVLLGDARPATVVLTTPNAEYNARFPSLPAGGLRHPDHRFEWTRAEFRAWAEDVARRFGYSVRFESVGPADPQLGAPTQMGVLTR